MRIRELLQILWYRESYSQMSGETVQRLSSLVRDRDLEVESLNQKIKSLLEVLQNEKDGHNIEDLEKRYRWSSGVVLLEGHETNTLSLPG
jgi:hypothetical protein